MLIFLRLALENEPVFVTIGKKQNGQEEGVSMNDHYYTNQPMSKSHPETWSTELNGFALRFKTDSGVFSKGQVDYGSRVLLETTKDKTFTNGDLLDVGCGYGAIGLTLAQSYSDRTIHMVDINTRALALAKENAAMNQIDNVYISSSFLYETIEKKNFAAIISNPPIRAGKKVVHQLLEEAYDHLKMSGTLMIVIQKKQGAPSAKKKIESIFGNVSRLKQDKGYWVLEARKNK